MEGNINVKVQTNGMIAIHPGDSTVMIHPLKMRGFIQDLALAKRRATQLKPEKIRIDELSYQPEKLHAKALLDCFVQSHCRGNQHNLKKRMYGVQVHSCYMNKPREKMCILILITRSN